MHIKKNLAIAAAVAVLAVPALGATNANAKVNNNIWYGADKTDVISHGVNVNGHYWAPGTPVYGGHYGSRENKPGTISGYIGAPGKNDGFIPESDLDTSPSNNQNTSNKSYNQLSNNSVNNSKLAQTGESNTGAKASIVGAITAMASVAFAGIEKFFKRV